MAVVRVLPAVEASAEVLAEIHRLLIEAFEGDFTDEDWDHTRGGWHVVAVDAGAIVAHAAVVPRALEVAGRAFRAGYVEAVATAPGRQRQGLGSLAMAEASALVRSRFELGALSTGSHRFYERLGWERWRGPTFVRDGSSAIRTPEEDDGVMVLRFGPSRDLDLQAPISCERRAGDDW